MKVTTRRVVSMTVALALVAALAATAAVPAFGGKPEGKDRKTTFSIEAQMFWMWPPGIYFDEGFRAKGAIRDSGWISFDNDWEMFPLTLVGKRGSLYIDSDGDVFVIADATGDHVDAIGATGSVVVYFEPLFPPGPGEAPPVLDGTCYLTLEGTIPP
jgi:hypothetical protein